MKAVLINADNIVQNVIVWNDGDVWSGPETVVLIDDNARVSPNFIYNGGISFSEPEPAPVPEEIRNLIDAREAARVSALAKLTSLGLTAEEIRAITG
jgi:hypothetical protein